MLRAATARCFAGKLGVQSDRVLNAVMNDRMVAKGLVLHWATAFFVDFLATEPMDDLVAILRKVRAWLTSARFWARVTAHKGHRILCGLPGHGAHGRLGGHPAQGARLGRLLRV